MSPRKASLRVAHAALVPERHEDGAVERRQG